MSAESICDACGKRFPMRTGQLGTWHKPSHWYERTDFPEGKPPKTWTACSRECIDKLAKEQSVPETIRPI